MGEDFLMRYVVAGLAFGAGGLHGKAPSIFHKELCLDRTILQSKAFRILLRFFRSQRVNAADGNCYFLFKALPADAVKRGIF